MQHRQQAIRRQSLRLKEPHHPLRSLESSILQMRTLLRGRSYETNAITKCLGSSVMLMIIHLKRRIGRRHLKYTLTKTIHLWQARHSKKLTLQWHAFLILKSADSITKSEMLTLLSDDSPTQVALPIQDSKTRTLCLLKISSTICSLVMSPRIVVRGAQIIASSRGSNKLMRASFSSSSSVLCS